MMLPAGRVTSFPSVAAITLPPTIAPDRRAFQAVEQPTNNGADGAGRSDRPSLAADALALEELSRRARMGYSPPLMTS